MMRCEKHTDTTNAPKTREYASAKVAGSRPINGTAIGCPGALLQGRPIGSLVATAKLCLRHALGVRRAGKGAIGLARPLLPLVTTLTCGNARCP